MDELNMNINYRTLSDKDYEPHPDRDMTIVIKTGCLQRIAKALEKMAEKNDEREVNKLLAEGQIAELRRRISALQGVITKLRKKNNELKTKVL